MVVWDEWKLVWYSGRKPQLFNLDLDPGEYDDRADDPDAAALAEGKKRLFDICDPEAVSAMAFADQRAHIEALGGTEACLNTFVLMQRRHQQNRHACQRKAKYKAGFSKSSSGRGQSPAP